MCIKYSNMYFIMSALLCTCIEWFYVTFIGTIGLKSQFCKNQTFWHSKLIIISRMKLKYCFYMWLVLLMIRAIFHGGLTSTCLCWMWLCVAPISGYISAYSSVSRSKYCRTVLDFSCLQLPVPLIKNMFKYDWRRWFQISKQHPTSS